MATFVLITKFEHRDDILKIGGRLSTDNNKKVTLKAETGLLMDDRNDSTKRTAALTVLVEDLKGQIKTIQVNETDATETIPANTYNAMANDIDVWIAGGMP